MTDKRFHVVCTGRGEHGRIDWNEVVLGDDGSIREIMTRQEPLAADRTRRKAVVAAESHRNERGTWRWKCPRCHLDKPLIEDHLRAWMSVTTSPVLDISKLPR